MHAFVSHWSASDVLRLVGEAPRWPESARLLPPAKDCVSGQRDFRKCRIGERLDSLGLAARPVDLIVPAKSARSSGGLVRAHLWSGIVPQRSMLDLGGGLLSCGAELIVIQLCSAQSKLDALLDAHASAVRAEAELAAGLGLEEGPTIDHPLKWERIRRLIAAAVVACEFAGTYRLPAGEKNVSYRASRLMSSASLASAIAEMGETSGTRRAARVCDLTLEGSASPMETVLGLMLTLPVEYGGFGIERPQLNCPVDVSSCREEGLADRDVVTPDFLWPEQRVAIEYDSDEFHAARGAGQSARDATRANILTTLGCRVFRATSRTVRAPEGVVLLARQISHALGISLEPTTPLQELRRRKLYLELMPRTKA